MLAMYMDSTNLKPEAGEKDITALCKEAMKYQMAAVCINPYRLELAGRLLAASTVKTCTVIGFPLGAENLSAKTYAARQALRDGADELDMVINIGAFKDKNYGLVAKEIKGVLQLKQEYEFILKVIVETAFLQKEELQDITAIVSENKADFIKTSTGFADRGVILEDIDIIKAHKSEQLKIKASGGIKTLDFALQLINTGVDRIGSSSAAALVEEYQQRGGQ